MTRQDQLKKFEEQRALAADLFQLQRILRADRAKVDRVFDRNLQQRTRLLACHAWVFRDGRPATDYDALMNRR